MEQLIISEDQNTVTYEGHTATFKPCNNATMTSCSKCCFFEFILCKEAPCVASERKDRQEGIFTIQEIPEIKK